jgi:hypothetical protein
MWAHMDKLASDGCAEAEARAHPRFGALAACEACERWFEAANRRLWVGWSGASITCVHCFFAAHAAVLFDDATGEDEREDTLAFLAEKDDESGEPIGGIAGYRARFAADHDRARCPWAVHTCLLCDPREIGEGSIEPDC